ncbi:peptidyl-prolyl cis-trans isomerase CYP95-like [Vespula squamosa]|uniref:Peptidyl-prolyl cis-trans isomerase CYP95-like n=1 Tax=Vespula squamosa TaxID=30214 RepID=A0ABD2BE46_VESSQ
MSQRNASLRRQKTITVFPCPYQSGNSSDMDNELQASVDMEQPDILPQVHRHGRRERHTSPRGSVVPNITVDIENDLPKERTGRRMLPDLSYVESCNNLTAKIPRSPRRSITPEDYHRSPHKSATPEDYHRSPHKSATPEDYHRSPHKSATLGDYHRSPHKSVTLEDYYGSPHKSPHKSITPEGYQRSPHKSITPEGYHRSPHKSVTPDSARSPRHSLVPARNNLPPDAPHSSRHSLNPEIVYNRSPRNSLVPRYYPKGPFDNYSLPCSPRYSLKPESSKSPRESVVNLEYECSPRKSIRPEIMEFEPTTTIEVDRSSQESLNSEYMGHSLQSSMGPELNRYSRGSITPDYSQGESICLEERRNPHRSVIVVKNENGSPCGSIVVNDCEMHTRDIFKYDEEAAVRERRIWENRRRGNFRGRRSRKMINLKRHDLKKTSDVQGTTRSHSAPAYLPSTSCSRAGRSRSRSGCSRGKISQVGAKRPVTTVSRISDGGRVRNEIYQIDDDSSDSVNFGMATYGSVLFQLKGAHQEARGTCDFVFRSLKIFSKTILFVMCLFILFTMSILMFILGLQFMKDCPREPHIPLYLIVGGTLGTVRTFWSLYVQLRSKRPRIVNGPQNRSYMSISQLTSITLTCFLIIWFALGNYWIINIGWPDYTPLLYDPDQWCHRTIYVYSLIHLGIVYSMIIIIFIISLGLASCRIFDCPWPESAK